MDFCCFFATILHSSVHMLDDVLFLLDLTLILKATVIIKGRGVSKTL